MEVAHRLQEKTCSDDCILHLVVQVFFYVCKRENGEKFRNLRLLRHNPIYFSSKNTRTIHHLRQMIIEERDRINELYATTIRLNVDYQFDQHVEVSMKEELFGDEGCTPRQKRLITFKK